MEFYNEVKAEIRAIQQQMVEAKKNDCAKALEDVNLFAKVVALLLGC